MSPAAREYILEERFIHEALAARAHRAFERGCQIWQQDGHIAASILLWPTDSVQAQDGSYLEGVVVAVLPPPEKRAVLWEAALKSITPYGVFVIEQANDRLTGTFETHHGARQWSRPIRRHGDVWVLGPEVVTNNRQHLGVLWAPNRGAA